MQDPNLTAVQQLVLLTSIRRLLANSSQNQEDTEEPLPITELLGQTAILNVISQVFTFDTNKDEETRSMKVSLVGINQFWSYSLRQSGYLPTLPTDRKTIQPSSCSTPASTYSRPSIASSRNPCKILCLSSRPCGWRATWWVTAKPLPSSSSLRPASSRPLHS
jgi:hypothetical protein